MVKTCGQYWMWPKKAIRRVDSATNLKIYLPCQVNSTQIWCGSQPFQRMIWYRIVNKYRTAFDVHFMVQINHLGQINH